MERRLHGARGIAAEEFQAFDPVDLALLRDSFDLGGLLLVHRDDQLADLFVRHAVACAEFVEHAPPAHAVARAQRAGRVVHAGVDHLAVARGHPIADAAGRLRDDHLMTGERGSPRDRQADHAGANHQNLH